MEIIEYWETVMDFCRYTAKTRTIPGNSNKKLASTVLTRADDRDKMISNKREDWEEVALYRILQRAAGGCETADRRGCEYIPRAAHRKDLSE